MTHDQTLQQVRDKLPEAAAISRGLLDYLIAHDAGDDEPVLDVNEAIEQLMIAITGLEARLIAVEKRSGTDAG